MEQEKTRAFFDELSKMVDEKLKSRQAVFGPENDSRPYSSLLTQDDEPVPFVVDNVIMQEPTVVTRF